MRTIKFICVLLALCALTSRAFSADDPDPIDTAFTTTFADNFKFLSARTIADEFDRGWRVIAAQPLHAGFFVMRYDADVNPKRDMQERTSVRFEFFFDIAEADTSRLIDLTNGTQVPHPAACVGDTLLFPIVTGAKFSHVKFSPRATEERVEKIYANYEAEARQVGKPATQPVVDGHFENRLADHLTLVMLTRGSAGTVSRRSRMESTSVIFEATHAGEFDIQRRVDNQPEADDLLSLRIVKKTNPLTVTLMYANEFDFFKAGHSETASQPLSYKPPGTLTLREGDRILMHIHGSRVDLPQTNPAPLPAIRVEESPLKFSKGPFE